MQSPAFELFGRGDQLTVPFFWRRYEVQEKAAPFERKQPKWMKYRKSSAKDRRLEKSMAWMTDSEKDYEEMEWQQYLHSLRDRY